MSSLTDIQTFDVMYNMTKLLIKRSNSASKKHNLLTSLKHTNRNNEQIRGEQMESEKTLEITPQNN